MGSTLLPGKKQTTLLKYTEDKFILVKIKMLYDPTDAYNFWKINHQKVMLSGPRNEVEKALEFLKLKMKKF